MAPSINELMRFVNLTHEFQQVKRAILVKNEDRQENDLEHSAQLALVAMYICNSAGLQLDTKRILEYALVHDLVEGYAGDTHFYDTNGRQGKKEREEKARKRLKAEFPEFARLHELIIAYEERADEESKFIYALDKLLPILNIYLDNGRNWQVENIGFDSLSTHKTPPISLSPVITVYYEQILQILRDNMHLFPPISASQAPQMPQNSFCRHKTGS